MSTFCGLAIAWTDCVFLLLSIRCSVVAEEQKAFGADEKEAQRSDRKYSLCEMSSVLTRASTAFPNRTSGIKTFCIFYLRPIVSICLLSLAGKAARKLDQ